jgi:hypothetical protein
MLKLKKIKPIGSQILVSGETYLEDDYNEAGILEKNHIKDSLKTYQTVLAIGDDVKFVKVGDLVEINFYKYAVFKEDPNSLKAMADNPIVDWRLNWVTMTDVEDNDVDCILVDQRDVKYIIEDCDEKTYKPKVFNASEGKQQLILPSNRIKL